MACLTNRLKNYERHLQLSYHHAYHTIRHMYLQLSGCCAAIMLSILYS